MKSTYFLHVIPNESNELAATYTKLKSHTLIQRIPNESNLLSINSDTGEMQMIIMDDLLTMSEASEYAQKSRYTLKEYIFHGMEYVLVGKSKRVFLRKQDIDKYIQENS